MADSTLAVTYLRQFDDDNFTIIIHEALPPTHTIFDYRNLIPQLTPTAAELVTTWLDDPDKVDNWYIHSMPLEGYIPFSPVTWLDDKTEIMGDNIY